MTASPSGPAASPSPSALGADALGTVLVTPRSFGSGAAPLAAELAAAGLRAVPGSATHDLDALAPVLAEATAWIAGTAPITEEHLRLAPRLKVIARYGVGVDNVDLAAAARHGITVTNTPAANSTAVADLAVGLLLAVLRRIPAADRGVRADDWSAVRGRELGALTLGIIGFGRIGTAVAARAQGFGGTVLASDPFVPPEAVRAAGAAPVPPEELAARSDAITLHLPGGTRVVDSAWLDGVRPGLVLVNAARAELVDETAVAAALRSGVLGGYAADTLSSEDGGGRSPLLAEDLADRVVITPHMGAQTAESVDRMGLGAVHGVIDVLAGRAPAHPVPPPPPTSTSASAAVSGGRP